MDFRKVQYFVSALMLGLFPVKETTAFREKLLVDGLRTFSPDSPALLIISPKPKKHIGAAWRLKEILKSNVVKS